MLTHVNHQKFINSKLMVRFPFLAILLLLALPLVWCSGTTWDSDTDDLLPTLISIENWRFFFWSVSRFGTLVPLLAKPFTDMRANLLFQNFIHALSLIILIYALSQVLYRNQSKNNKRSVIFISLVTIFLLINPMYLKLLISGLPYAAPLGIFGIALVVTNSNLSKKFLVPLLILLVAVSCWINPLNGYYLAPLLFLLLSLKSFKNIFYELTFIYLFLTFGLFFIILGVANGETSGTVLPNFRAFGVLNWWLSLFLVQLVLLVIVVLRGELRKFRNVYFSFLMTWVSIFALTSIKHIHNFSEAPRYFITAIFVSMCITMWHIEVLIESGQFKALSNKKTLELFRNRSILSSLVLILVVANFLIARNLQSDYPLREPQKKLLSSLFLSGSEDYRFASGDFWFTWPTKLFVTTPEDIFVTSYESENQYDVSTDSKEAVQSRLNDGDVGLCFGEIKDCEKQIQEAVFRMYGAFKVQADIVDLGMLRKEPILVHKLRILIALK